jgi:predicted glycogen debranching enzyme
MRVGLLSLDTEWLEADRQGGFASGTASLARTRRYHALLLCATQPPGGRVVLVNGIEAWVTTPAGRTWLSAQLYGPDIIYPDGAANICGFTADPWPCWQFRLADGSVLQQEILVDPDSGDTLLRWRGAGELQVRPLLSGRDYHALHAENPAFSFAAAQTGGNVSWRPYPSKPAISALTNGSYRHDPAWYRNFLYGVEQQRGLDHTEDLASPGIFTWPLAGGDAVMVLRAGDGRAVRPARHAARVFEYEASRRAASPSAGGVGPQLLRSAASYVADRGRGSTIIAGYPWFTDWGRDSFIALRGLLLTTGKLDEAEAVLLAWADLVSEGMLPNRFPDDGPPEYNSCDASLWFLVAVHDLLRARPAAAATRQRLRGAVDRIIAGYKTGTRYGIGVDRDGLLRAGEPNTQLTWMDARAGGRAVTPRVGKPVELQALWFNALRIASAWDPSHAAAADDLAGAVVARFADADTGGLVDVVDADHIAGTSDASLRPNQIFAVGGLPFALADGALARSILACVEQHLYTKLGLRTLAPGDPRYQPHYGGGPLQRDAAYHQGTAWPWLIGPFVEAWLRVHGDGPEQRAHARANFLAPLEAHLQVAGLGHISEIVDGDAPHTPGGCPFQAWSLGEFLRARAMTEIEVAHGQ